VHGGGGGEEASLIPSCFAQAAVGSVALDQARSDFVGTTLVNGTLVSINERDDPNVERGLQVLTLAVLSILATAPVGAAIISFTGPRWLTKSSPSVHV